MELNSIKSQETLSQSRVNEIAPEPIEVTADGEFKIQLPEDTQYFENQAHL